MNQIHGCHLILVLITTPQKESTKITTVDKESSKLAKAAAKLAKSKLKTQI